MFVIRKMRLNKFEPKPIVSNRELFLAKGDSPAVIKSKDTPDCYNQPTIDGASKTKVLGLAQQVIAKSAEHHTGDDTKPLNKNAKDV